MGRHPRWGQELCVVDGSHVVQVVEGFLDKIAQQTKPGERIADVVERIEVTRLRKDFFSDV
jgi:dissimilatory sulfite reductase (desulfoviridin) alpha/beta subunit